MSVSATPSLAGSLKPADRPPDPHLEALLRPFDGTTRQRVKTMIERALRLGMERAEIIAQHEVAQARYERAAANMPSRYSDACTPQRRKVLDDLEEDCERLESRYMHLDAQFVGVTR